MPRALLFVLVFALVQGCATLGSKLGEDSQWGHPYSGTVKDLNALPCVAVASGPLLFVPALFVVADLALSAVADTLLVPADLLIEPEHARQKLILYQAC